MQYNIQQYQFHFLQILQPTLELEKLSCEIGFLTNRDEGEQEKSIDDFCFSYSILLRVSALKFC
uniref:Uncharacterized protein n=1 Tax=Spironucleus salmonicida TaxID=348837 RepID=V6LLE1_9EUKA|eukprot:EST45465.1 Hypothetical protein SS50377_14619 [Spironucleus salmonicida]